METAGSKPGTPSPSRRVSKIAEQSENRGYVLRLSTQGVEARSRASAIRDYLRDLIQVDVRPRDPEGPLDYSAGLQVTRGATWGGAVTTSVVFTRSAALARDGSDDLMLALPGAPMIVDLPSAAQFHVQPGEAVLVSQAREVRLVLGTGTCWALRVPHRDIAKMLPQISAAPILTIRGDVPMLSLLGRYGRLLDDEPMADPQSRDLAARHLQEMLALTLGASREFREDVASNTIVSVRFKAALAEIAAHLGERELSLEWLAIQLKITSRHLQRVFSAHGTSFSDELRRARLTRARAMLDDPRHASRTISAIALECGFPEATVLNRLFRQEYGMTPSEARRRR